MAQSNVKLTVDGSQATRALKNVQGQTNKLQSAIGGLQKALALGGLGLLTKNSVQAASNFKALQLRLQLLTSEYGEFAQAQQVVARAQKTFNLSVTEATAGIADIFARLRPLGTSLEDIESTFVGFNSIAKLSGVTGQQASAAFTQLAQALGSGRLQGDEFRSISEQVPGLLVAISEETGIATGKLKEFASKGLLESDIVLRALAKSAEEGANKSATLIAKSPAEKIKALQNSLQQLNIELGEKFLPAVADAALALAKLTNAFIDFINSDAGQATAIIAGFVLAAKALSVAIPLVIASTKILILKLSMVGAQSLIASAGFTGLNAATLLAAGGVGKLTLALGAFKVALASTGIGLAVLAVGAFTTAIVGAINKQKELNNAIKDGSETEVNKLLEEQVKSKEKIDKLLEKANGRQKRSLQMKLQEINHDIKMLEGRKITLESDKLINEKLKERLDIQKESTEEIKNQQTETDKLKEKMTAVGEEIESSIKNNLREAITGAQSFGQAMTNVLNRIRDKIIDAQLEKLIGGFGESFGKSAGGGKGKGIGGFLGSVIGGLFANGGRPPVGKASIVGERGPELFVPSVAGTIVPNNKLGGGGTSNIVNVSVDATGSAVSGNNADAQQLGVLIGAAVQNELIKETQPGGLLAR